MARKLGNWFRRHWKALVVLYILALVASHVVIWLRSDEQTQQAEAESGDKRFITIDGRKLAYLEWGGADPSKPPLILLHGSPSQGAGDFETFGPQLALDGRRVIAIDRWGWGDSERRVPDYSFEADANAVLTLMDQLRIETAHVAGWSYGGGPAILLGSLHPDRIRSVTLIAAIGMQEGEGSGSYLVEHLKYRIGTPGDRPSRADSAFRDPGQALLPWRDDAGLHGQ